VEHFTYFEETGALHYHLTAHITSVAVPLDGNGPTYTSHSTVIDSDNIRAVKGGDALVVTDTDLDTAVAEGSDGSKAYFQTHAHLTYNANGVQTVDFDATRMVCT